MLTPDSKSSWTSLYLGLGNKAQEIPKAEWKAEGLNAFM